MKLSLLVQGSPYTTSSCHSALALAQAWQEEGHAIHRVFFYKDAVLIANKLIETPSDEFNLQQAWQALGSEVAGGLTICVTAGQRRGITDTAGSSNLAHGFHISGLGQVVEAMQESDRFVTF